MFKHRHLFFLPSFYLLITFSLAYFIYLLDVIKWERPPLELHYWCIITILTAFFSVAVHSHRCSVIINERSFKAKIKAPFIVGKVSFLIVLIGLAIGVLGIIKYILDYANFLGAFGIFYSFFTEDTGQLRSLAENVDSVGTQLSYFSWLAAFIITAEVAVKNIGKKWIFAIVGVVMLNSLFLDRTRPVWLIFTCALIYFLITYDSYSKKKIIYFISGICTFFISIFILIGSLLGKGADDVNYTKFNLPPSIQPLFLYLTSSFAYLGRLIYVDAPCNYSPARVTYPIQKVLLKFKLVDQPPNQILDFFTVPLLTNVGTFLEPFFQDGGRLFLVLGIILHTFIFDRVVLYLMKNISQMAVIAISTICFINFIAFFVPKITSTATWFILLFAYLLSKYHSMQPKKPISIL